MTYRWLVVFGTSLCIFLINQAVHWWILARKPELAILNTTAFFGLVGTPLTVALVVVLGLLLVWRLRYEFAQSTLGRLAAVLILAGALSNIFDRLYFGGVIDYIRFFSISTFNLADVEIVIGAIFLAYSLQGKQKSAEKDLR